MYLHGYHVQLPQIPCLERWTLVTMCVLYTLYDDTLPLHCFYHVALLALNPSRVGYVPRAVKGIAEQNLGRARRRCVFSAALYVCVLEHKLTQSVDVGSLPYSLTCFVRRDAFLWRNNRGQAPGVPCAPGTPREAGLRLAVGTPHTLDITER